MAIVPSDASFAQYEYACSTTDVVGYCHDSGGPTIIDCDTYRVDLLCYGCAMDYCKLHGTFVFFLFLFLSILRISADLVV